jgi:hypothetical protein
VQKLFSDVTDMIESGETFVVVMIGKFDNPSLQFVEVGNRPDI